jgi:hypothetical protein
MNPDSGSRTRRGTIIKVPSNTPGLLVVDGAQKSFVLEGVWRAAVAPSLNQVVDVEVDSAGTVVSVTAVDPQQIAKERLNQLGGAAQEQGKQAADLARKGIGALAARMGKVSLGAAVALWIAWFFLPALKFSMFMGATSFTFWDVLGANVGQRGLGVESHGLFALLGVAAIAAPFAAPFLRHPRARFLYAAPAAYFVLACLKIRWSIGSAANTAGQMGAATGLMTPELQKYIDDMTKTAVKAMMDAISVGFGTYVILAASIVLAVQAFKAPAVSESPRS